MQGKASKAVIYTRVSTGEQAENGTSLAGQLEACKSKADAIGAQVVNVYEDAGVSGAFYQARPGIQAALRDLEAGKADTLIIANLSRFSRDREHQSAIKKRVTAAGARLVFCDMSFDDTPEGDLAFGIMGTFADYERKLIKERTMKGRKRRAKEGFQPCRNYSPFGYHVVSSKDVLRGDYPLGTEGTYQIIEEQARLVREMFSRVASGESIRSIARWLTQLGVPTPRGAVVWNWTTLQRLLQHPIYKGLGTFGRFERRYDESRAQLGYKTTYTLRERPAEQWICFDAPALVDETTWNIAQERIKTNRGRLGGRADRKYLLTGLILCPQCGQKMRAYRVRHNPKNKDSAHYHLYECRLARPATNLGGKVCCNKQYRGYWAEPLVISALQEFVRRPELASAAIEAYKRVHMSEQTQPDATQLQKQLADLQKQEQATIKAQIAGIMAGTDSSLYESILRDIAAKRGHLTAALARAEHPAGKAPRKHDAALITEAVAAVYEVLKAPDSELTPGEKQGLLARVIEAIYPEGNEGLKICLKPLLTSDQTVSYVTT